MKPKIRQLSPVLIELFWDEKPNDELLSQLLSWEISISNEFGDEIIEIRMGFQTLSCQLKSDLTLSKLKKWQDFLQTRIDHIPLPTKLWKIPVCYDPEIGKDVIAFCKSKSLDLVQLITLHSEPIYRIHFFGFLPGFMYLNGLNPALHLPRKSIPDQKIEPGSVAIGGSQTGIYPTERHIIGKTPISLVDPRINPPIFAKPGEQIHFVPIDRNQFLNFSTNLDRL